MAFLSTMPSFHSNTSFGEEKRFSFLSVRHDTENLNHRGNNKPCKKMNMPCVAQEANNKCYINKIVEILVYSIIKRGKQNR